jgi:hypothetical protein
MLARAADHRDQEVFGALHHVHRRIQACGAETLLPRHAQPPFDIFLREPPHRQVRVLVEKTFGVRLAEAPVGDGLRVLRAHDDQRLRVVVDVVRADGDQGAGDRRKNALRGDALVVVHVVRALGADHGDSARLARQAALDVERLPRARCLVLGGKIGVLRRRAESGHVAERGDRTTDVDQHEPDRAPDGGVGLPAGTERVVAGVDVQLLRHRTVDDDEWRAEVRRRLDAIEVERFLAHRLDRSHEQRKILRPAARHHGIGGEPQRRRLAVARRDLRHRLIPGAVAVRQHALDAARRRRHDGQAVAPAAAAHELVHRVEVVLTFEACARGLEQL